jgi:hypothetical protein
MAALADGERRAFDPVYRTLWPVLVRFVAVMSTDRMIAEDIAQQALLRILGRASTFDRTKDALTWSMTIAVNEYRSYRRKLGKPAADQRERALTEPIDDDTPEAIALRDNLVIHVPTLGAREANVVPASRLISNRHTTQYWEETGITGKLMQQVMGVDKYVWDFWTIYGPKAVWSDERLPPTPDFWQHQLDGLAAEKKLHANVFAAKIDEFLAQIPAAPVASTVAVGAGKSE